MRLQRFYQNVSLKENETIKLSNPVAHHVQIVLRGKLGDTIFLFNGKPYLNRYGDFESEIIAIKKKEVIVTLHRFIEKHTESPLSIELGQGLARSDKMDFIIQKSVELGVSKIVPLTLARSLKIDEKRIQNRMRHWEKISISACEQSGRTILPTISIPLNLQDWLNSLIADARFVLSPYANSSKLPSKLAKKAAILIGPEGGLTNEEVNLAEHHAFKPLYLGPRILRTETASLAAISLLQGFYGDMLAQTLT